LCPLYYCKAQSPLGAADFFFAFFASLRAKIPNSAQPSSSIPDIRNSNLKITLQKQSLLGVADQLKIKYVNPVIMSKKFLPNSAQPTILHFFSYPVSSSAFSFQSFKFYEFEFVSDFEFRTSAVFNSCALYAILPILTPKTVQNCPKTVTFCSKHVKTRPFPVKNFPIFYFSAKIALYLYYPNNPLY
jgi:hypothetical protein